MRRRPRRAGVFHSQVFSDYVRHTRVSLDRTRECRPELVESSEVSDMSHSQLVPDRTHAIGVPVRVVRDAILRIACWYTSTPPPTFHPPARDWPTAARRYPSGHVSSRQDWSQTSRTGFRSDTDRRSSSSPHCPAGRHYVTVTNYGHSGPQYGTAVRQRHSGVNQPDPVRRHPPAGPAARDSWQPQSEFLSPRNYPHGFRSHSFDERDVSAAAFPLGPCRRLIPLDAHTPTGQLDSSL